MAKILRHIIFVYVLVTAATCAMAAPSYHFHGNQRGNTALLRKIMKRPELIRNGLKDTVTTNAYLKFHIHLKRSNVSLAAIPDLYYLARDKKRDFFGEIYAEVALDNQCHIEEHRKVKATTIYRNHSVLDNINTYMSPMLFNTTLFDDFILSPLVEQNRRFYHYRSVAVNDSVTRFSVHPKMNNTQLVKASFDVLPSGQITIFRIEGEYDMCRFDITGEMGKDGVFAIFPTKCHVNATVNITGNKILLDYSTHYNMPAKVPTEEMKHDETARFFDSIRPTALSQEETEAINLYHNQLMANDSTKTSYNSRTHQWTRFLWDVMGDNMLNKIKTHIGNQEKGNLHIGPIFNPLYFGYTRTKGVFYKFDIKGNYNFSSRQALTFRPRLGYSFRQHQLFYTVPVYYYFNRQHNGFVHLEVSNGNRISDSSVLDELKHETRDSVINWDRMNLNYFKDASIQLTASYDIDHNKLAVETGIVGHKRTAVNKAGLTLAGKPTHYTSLAPYLQVRWQPWKLQGPIFAMQYERGLKGILGSDSEYERMEYDAQFKLNMSCMRTLQLRGGMGLYTSRSKGNYFLDYYNFRQNYVPGGWNDDWTGDFEILRSEWYNSSKYYIRSNMTYESPLMLMSYLPVVGKIVEKERIYFSMLAVEKLWPYMEIGYGFVNRVFSIGAFGGISRHRFEGFGMKVGLELFNKW